MLIGVLGIVTSILQVMVAMAGVVILVVMKAVDTDNHE